MKEKEEAPKKKAAVAKPAKAASKSKAEAAPKKKATTATKAAKAKADAKPKKTTSAKTEKKKVCVDYICFLCITPLILVFSIRLLLRPLLPKLPRLRLPSRLRLNQSPSQRSPLQNQQSPHRKRNPPLRRRRRQQRMLDSFPLTHTRLFGFLAISARLFFLVLLIICPPSRHRLPGVFLSILLYNG